MKRDGRSYGLDDVMDDGVVDPTSEVVSGTRWGTAAMVLTQGVRVTSQIVLTKLLFPGDFGTVTLAFAFAQFLDIFRDLGIATAIVQRPVISYRLLNSLFWISVLFGLACSTLFVVAAPLLAQGLEDGRAVGVFRLIGLSIFISSFGMVHQGVIRRRRRFARVAGVTLTNGLVTAGSSVALALLGASVWSLAVGQVVGALASMLVAWQGSGFRVRLHLRLSDTVGVWGFGLSITGFNVANFFFLNADKLIVGKMFGEVALGLYGLGQRILFYPIASVSQSIQSVLFPTFSRLDDRSIRHGYLRACAGVALVTFPLMMGFTVVAGPLIRTVFGEQWDGAVVVSSVLAPIGALQAIQHTTAAIYTAKGRGRELLLVGVSLGILSVGAYFAGTPWGINGVAIAYAVVMVAISYPMFAIPFGFVGLRVHQLWTALQPITIATLAMTVVTLAARLALPRAEGSDLLVLYVCVPIGIATYVAVLAALRPPVLKDLRRLIRRTPVS
jgi:O-antigen/teichoic acid export membrane protein